MIAGPGTVGPISPSDKLYLPKTMAWKVLQDAICKSCFTNDVSCGKTSTSNPDRPMILYFNESRQWIMDMGEDAPGAPLNNEMVAGFECGFCVDLLSEEIGNRRVFTRFMRKLWKDWDARVVDRLTSLRRSATLQKMKSEKFTSRPGPVKGAKMIRDVDTALKLVKESREWGR